MFLLINTTPNKESPSVAATGDADKIDVNDGFLCQLSPRISTWLDSPCGRFFSSDGSISHDDDNDIAEGIEVGIKDESEAQFANRAPTVNEEVGFKTPPRTRPRLISFNSKLNANVSSPDDNPFKRLTASEAYTKGMVLEYMCSYVESFNNKADDYESKWQGHQPLTPNPTRDDTSSRQLPLTASEQRLMRARRRRGAITTTTTTPARVGSVKLDRHPIVSPPRMYSQPV